MAVECRVPAWFALSLRYTRVLPTPAPDLSVEEAHEKRSVDYENEIIHRARSAAHVPTLETK